MVYNPAGTTLLGTLAEAHNVSLEITSSRLSSWLQFTVDLESEDDIALLQPRRVIRVFDGGIDMGAYFVHDMPAVVAEPDELPGVSYTCLSLESWLGSGRVGGAVVYPFGGVEGKRYVQISGRWDPRRFGAFDQDFDDEWWPNAPAAGPLTTEGWPDDQAEALAFNNRALFRRTIPTGDVVGPARMFMVAQWDVRVTVYRNSEPVLRKNWGETGLFTVDEYYDGLGDVIVIKAEKLPGNHGQVVGRVGWTWIRLEVKTDLFGNENYRLGTVLRRTFNSADFPEAESFWLRFNDYDEIPGVSVGFVLDTLLREAQDRGALPSLTWNFNSQVDSDGEPWVEELTHGWRLGSTVGWVAEQLTEWGCQFRVASDGELIVTQQTGEDLSETVTLDRAEQVSLSGEGVAGTSMLVISPQGVLYEDDKNAVGQVGFVETAATFGTATDPWQIRRPARELLARTAWPRDDCEVLLSEASPQPFEDFLLLDWVSFPTRDGGVQVGRVVRLFGAQNDEDGTVDWTVQLDAVSATTNPVPSTVTENV